MKTISKIIPLMAVTAAATMISCSKQTKLNNAPEAFATDTLAWTDSVSANSCKAKVTVTGMIPKAGPTQLVDSVKTWIAGYFNGPSSDIEATVKAYGSALLDSAKTTFTGLNMPGYTTGFEYIYSFKPVFESDSVLTYIYTAYVYEGGAHGTSTAVDQTFVNSTGQRLTADNMFASGSESKVINLVRQGLYEQFFKPQSADWDNNIKAMMLIDPDSLKMPSTPPSFMADGINFTYQQYEIAPYALGMPSCTVPYDSIRQYMKPEVARLIAPAVNPSK